MFAFFVERVFKIIAMRRSVTVVAQPFVLKHDAQRERDQRDGDDQFCQPNYRILHQAGGDGANGEEIDEIARGLVIGLELSSTWGHIVVIAAPGDGIVRHRSVIISSAVDASEPTGDDLQAAQGDGRNPEDGMQGAAETAADRQCYDRTRKCQANGGHQTVFVNTEPPPSYVSDADLFSNTIERWLRFAESNCDDAKGHQHKPDSDHQGGMNTPMNWDSHSQKIKMHVRRNMCLNPGHCHHRRF